MSNPLGQYEAHHAMAQQYLGLYAVANGESAIFKSEMSQRKSTPIKRKI